MTLVVMGCIAFGVGVFVLTKQFTPGGGVNYNYKMYQFKTLLWWVLAAALIACGVNGMPIERAHSKPSYISPRFYSTPVRDHSHDNNEPDNDVPDEDVTQVNK